jgi:hypothetical protein
VRFIDEPADREHSRFGDGVNGADLLRGKDQCILVASRPQELLIVAEDIVDVAAPIAFWDDGSKLGDV